MAWQRWFSLFLMVFSGWVYADGPGRVTVRSVRSTGQGCPVGTARAVISSDAQSFSLLMDDYIVQADSSRPTARRDCDIEVDLDIPSGWNFALISADYRGFADLPSGAVGIHRVIYAFEQTRDRRPGYSNGQGFEFAATQFRGPMSEDYSIRHELSVTTAPRSLCSRGGVQTLYMNTLLTARMMQARGWNQTATIALDSLDGEVASQNYRFAWFRCNNFATPQPQEPDERPWPPQRPPRPPGRR